LIIDASHDNCRVDVNTKDPLKQIDIIWEVLTQIIPSLENKWINAKKAIKWFMVESYIYDWNQKYIDEETVLRWKSLTDPCIWLERTQKLILEMHKNI
jgi:phospho-2-dehydro-3-deoxyheptonate aldolase